MNIQVNKPRKNKFDLSHEVKQSGNMGVLYPCYIQEVVPGDSFRVNTQQMVRFSPLLAPMMHNIDFKMDYFFVPYRLVWKEWKDFITGGEDGNDLPSYPRIEVTKPVRDAHLTAGSLADYLGVPPYVPNDNLAGAWSQIGATTEERQYISALPFRAYQLIYHEYFRDQNVGTEYIQHDESGRVGIGNVPNHMDIRKSNWEKDYFTSSLPFLQRGAEVQLPLGQIAVDKFQFDNGFIVQNNTTLELQPTTGDLYGNLPIGSPIPGSYSGQLVGDIQSVTINELRKASALQQWLELMARAGSRYREQIYAVFGERIPDYTVQIPQYLGGGKTPIMISEVLSTYSADGTTDRPQGDMTGHALGLGDGIGFQQSFTEHGIILGLCRVIPKSSYVQGLNKFWTKFDKFDHYFPQFANLGEQEVTKSELYASGNKQLDNQVFGYQQRYAEYKYSQNRIAGDFRTSLKHWELSRRFPFAPFLSNTFVECTPDDRIFAVTETETHKIWISLYHKVDALRPIPYFSNPQLT